MRFTKLEKVDFCARLLGEMAGVQIEVSSWPVRGTLPMRAVAPSGGACSNCVIVTPAASTRPRVPKACSRARDSSRGHECIRCTSFETGKLEAAASSAGGGPWVTVTERHVGQKRRLGSQILYERNWPGRRVMVAYANSRSSFLTAYLSIL